MRKVNRRKHIDKKLLIRLRIFAFIFIVMLGIIAYNIFQNTISIPLASLGIIIGIFTGLIAGRMFDIRWHEEKSQVVAQVDGLGVAVIILYIVFAIFRSKIFMYWLHIPASTAFTICFFAGSMLGRLLGMGFNVRTVLREQGL